MFKNKINLHSSVFKIFASFLLISNSILLSMEVSIENQFTLVSGSTQGIGKAAAEALAEAGATVVLIARNENKLKDVADNLPKPNGQSHSYLVADFSNPMELKKVITNWVNEGNHADILVNNTGGPKGGAIAVAPVEEFIAAFNQHLICNHILVQALLPKMKANNFGKIINIGLAIEENGKISYFGSQKRNQLIGLSPNQDFSFLIYEHNFS